MYYLLHERIEKIFIIIFILLLIFLIFLNIKFFLMFEDDESNIVLNFEHQEEKFKYDFAGKENIDISLLKTDIEKSNLDDIEGEKSLVIYKMENLWHRVYFNDKYIGGNGEFFNNKYIGSNDINLYDIPDYLIQEENKLIIESYGVHDENFISYKPVITDYENATKIKYFVENYSYGILYFTLGLTSVLIIFYFIFSIIFSSLKKYWKFILGLLFLSLSQYYYLPMYLNTINVFIFKKIILITLLMAMIFISYGFFEIYKKKSALILGLIGIIMSVFVSLQTNITQLIEINSAIEIFIILSVLNWLTISIKESWVKISDRIISYGLFALLSSFIIEWIVSDFVSFEINMIFFGIILFVISMISLLLGDLENLVETAKQSKRETHHYYKKSIRDNMTGLYNSQYIKDQLKNANYNYSLIMFDIDDFKEINDNYGHSIGDEAIIKVAETAQNTIRKSDMIGRYGGDEFIIIAKECNAENAHRIAKDIKNRIETTKILGINEINLEISVGIYENYVGLNGEVALKKVDERLYQAKRNGKSTIVWEKNG